MCLPSGAMVMIGLPYGSHLVNMFAYPRWSPQCVCVRKVKYKKNHTAINYSVFSTSLPYAVSKLILCISPYRLPAKCCHPCQYTRNAAGHTFRDWCVCECVCVCCACVWGVCACMRACHIGEKGVACLHSA